MVNRTLALLLLAAGPALAQAPLQAQAADPALQADPGNDLFQRAKNLFDQGKTNKDAALLQRSIELFNGYLGEFPTHPNAEAAWLYLGQAYYQSGQTEDAKRCFHTLVNRYRTGPWVGAAAFTLAHDHYVRREYALAAPLYQQFADNAAQPENRARGHYMTGVCLQLTGRDREAAGWFKMVLGNPAGAAFAAKSQLALGHLSVKAGKLREALEFFGQAIDSNDTPKVRGEAALHASLAASKLGQDDLAAKYLKLVLVTPGMEDYRADAAIALMRNAFESKDYKGVLDAWQKSGTRATDEVEAAPPAAGKPIVVDEKKAARLLLASRAMLQLKQVTEAMELLRRIERTMPPQHELTFQAAYYRLLAFYELEGEHVPDQVDAFLQIYRKARPADPRVHTALLLKAESLFSKKQIAKAAQVYSEIDVSKIGESNRAGMLYQRGWCLAEAGDPQGAVRSLAKFIADYPKDPRVPAALAKRAKALQNSGESNKAIEDYDRLIAAGGDFELTSYAWLESARMRRAEGNIPDMIARYRGLLGKLSKLDKPLLAEANYFIGWGLVKTNQPNEAVEFLAEARTLQPDAYKKHAGLLLALGYYQAQNLDKLIEEIDTAGRENYLGDIPEQTIRWAGLQAYNAGKFETSARYLARVSNAEEPRETPKEVWRYLGKSLLESGKPEEALKAIDNVLAAEDNPSWKADGLLDQGRARFALGQLAEARKSVDQAAELRPDGRVGAGVRVLSGDLKAKAGDFGGAAAEYLIVVNFLEDRDLKPLALWKLANALEKKGEGPEATKYRAQLLREFPNWEAPKQ